MNLSIIIPLLLGWLAGWFVNYLADVLPITRRFSRPECPHCHTAYSTRDYLSFRKCSSCGARPSVRRFIAQAAMLVLTVFVWFFPHPHLPFILAFILLVYLAVVFIIDVEYRLILHPLSWTGLGIGLVIGIVLNSAGTTIQSGIVHTVIGGLVGFGIMLIFYYAGEAYVRYMSRKRGLPADEVALGFGDVNLAGILGMLLGWPSIILGLFFAILAAGLVSLVLIARMLISKKYKAFTAIPYAPFLILGALFLIFIY